MKGGLRVRAAGIAAEYNPFHTGHAGQIARTREALGEDCAVVAVMSGSWTQQADCAIAGKWTRARLALMGGADLVLELPTVWACSSAESFAQGAVSILEAAGVIDALSFGSECGETGALERAAAALDSPDYPAALRPFLDQGLPFAAARQRAVEALAGEEIGGLLRRPNNNLGVEYIRALNALGSSIRPMTVLRSGADHNEAVSLFVKGSLSREEQNRLFWQAHPVLSASSIWMHLMDGEWDLMEPYLPAGGRAVLEGNTVSLPALEKLRWAMLARARTMAAADWAALPDSGGAEGLPRRLEKAGRTCTSLDEFFSLAKTKRYTRARLERLLLWAFLGLTAADVPERPPYIRVLGFNSRGREVLKAMKRAARLPILTKPAHARELDGPGRRLFELEARCTDLYGLCLEHVPAPGQEWTQGPVIL